MPSDLPRSSPKALDPSDEQTSMTSENGANRAGSGDGFGVTVGSMPGLVRIRQLRQDGGRWKAGLLLSRVVEADEVVG